MRIEPASCTEAGVCRQLIDTKQGFQPFEREFNLPPQPVCGEYLPGRVALDRQRCANNHELRGGQRARIQRLLLAAALNRLVLDCQSIKVEISRQTSQKRGKFVARKRCCVLHPPLESGLTHAELNLILARMGQCPSCEPPANAPRDTRSATAAQVPSPARRSLR